MSLSSPTELFRPRTKFFLLDTSIWVKMANNTLPADNAKKFFVHTEMVPVLTAEVVFELGTKHQQAELVELIQKWIFELPQGIAVGRPDFLTHTPLLDLSNLMGELYPFSKIHGKTLAHGDSWLRKLTGDNPYEVLVLIQKAINELVKLIRLHCNGRTKIILPHVRLKLMPEIRAMLLDLAQKNSTVAIPPELWQKDLWKISGSVQLLYELVAMQLMMYPRQKEIDLNSSIDILESVSTWFCQYTVIDKESVSRYERVLRKVETDSILKSCSTIVWRERDFRSAITK